MKSKKTLTIIIIAVSVVLVAGLGALGFFGFWQPYSKAVSSFPQDKMVYMYLQPNDRILIRWPQSDNTDRYLLEILIPQEGVPEEEWAIDYSAQIQGKNEHMLTPLPNEPRTIRIRASTEYKFLIGKEPRFRLSEDSVSITDVFTVPTAPTATWTADPDADTVDVKLTMDNDCFARVFSADSTEPLLTLENRQVTLTFGEGKLLPMPGFHESRNITFEACRQTDSYIFYGAESQPVTITREDLLSLYIALNIEENPGNSYTITWNEAKGDYYLLQHRNNEKDKWEELGKYAVDAPLTYTTKNLTAYSYHEYRVITYQKDDPADADPLSKSDVSTLQTDSSLEYSTIWPIKDLKIYSDTAKTTELGTAAKGKALCILALEEGMFYVYTKNGYGYIDSNYCMINLPDFLGELIKYNIANSYESMFALHEVPIPEVTGQVVTGYEHVQISEGNYLVPYIYPAALKLEQAGLAAQKENYYLKIYDSYRPQKATQDLYSIMEKMCPDPVPQSPTVNEDGTLTYPTDEEGNILYQLKEDGTLLTIQEYITDNNRYALNYFLAKGTSRHNRGAALDLTLEKDGEEVEMQTPIHDLSWYSETAKNNTYAKKLASIMKGAGFTGLSSEWWHFQDDKALKDLNLPALYNGVTPEGWFKDYKGWRYRRNNGAYYTDCKKTIDGTEYTFDAQGYLISHSF